MKKAVRSINSEPEFTLAFEVSELDHWAAAYAHTTSQQWKREIRLVEEIGPDVQKRGYWTRDEFLLACVWKSPRTKSRCAANDAQYVQEVTKAALASANEQFRIEALTLLCGVSWPTASVLLHFGTSDQYPILDFRALWSLGHKKPPAAYSFSFWLAYAKFCRQLARTRKISMRHLDRALWNFSKQGQL